MTPISSTLVRRRALQSDDAAARVAGPARDRDGVPRRSRWLRRRRPRGTRASPTSAANAPHPLAVLARACADGPLAGSEALDLTGRVDELETGAWPVPTGSRPPPSSSTSSAPASRACPKRAARPDEPRRRRSGAETRAVGRVGPGPGRGGPGRAAPDSAGPAAIPARVRTGGLGSPRSARRPRCRGGDAPRVRSHPICGWALVPMRHVVYGPRFVDLLGGGPDPRRPARPRRGHGAARGRERDRPAVPARPRRLRSAGACRPEWSMQDAPTVMSDLALTVVMPAFNEAEILETSVKTVVKGCASAGGRSRSSSSRTARPTAPTRSRTRWRRRFPKVRVEHRAEADYGRALRAGLLAAQRRRRRQLRHRLLRSRFSRRRGRARDQRAERSDDRRRLQARRRRHTTSAPRCASSRPRCSAPCCASRSACTSPTRTASRP